MKKQNQEKAEKENKDESQQMLSWFQILMLIGRPLWDKKRKKWRVWKLHPRNSSPPERMKWPIIRNGVLS